MPWQSMGRDEERGWDVLFHLTQVYFWRLNVPLSSWKHIPCVQSGVSDCRDSTQHYRNGTGTTRIRSVGWNSGWVSGSRISLWVLFCECSFHLSIWFSCSLLVTPLWPDTHRPVSNTLHLIMESSSFFPCAATIPSLSSLQCEPPMPPPNDKEKPLPRRASLLPAFLALGHKPSYSPHPPSGQVKLLFSLGTCFSILFGNPKGKEVSGDKLTWPLELSALEMQPKTFSTGSATGL